jgi:5-methyltetrahydrofolate--homocysteine methyltransferase
LSTNVVEKKPVPAAQLSFREALARQVIVIDGAMGTMTQNLDLTDQDFGGSDFRMLGDLLSFSNPEAVRDIHLKYFRAGSNAVETNTFGASPMRLSEYRFGVIDLTRFEDIPPELEIRTASYEDIAYWLNRRSCEIAAAARDLHRADADYDGRPLYVFGSIGPSNRVLSSTRRRPDRVDFRSYRTTLRTRCAA